MTSKTSHHAWASSPQRQFGAGAVRAVFEAARRLDEDARAGISAAHLKGRNLGMLATLRSGRHEASPLESAALELGARVAKVRIFGSHESRRGDLVSMARILGRLYDAIDCGGLDASVVEMIRLESGVPTHMGLGLDDHPARVLGDLLTLSNCRDSRGLPSTIRFLGDSGARRARVFLEAAEDVGFVVTLAESASAPPSGEHFLVDATLAPQWSLFGPIGPISEIDRSANHRLVIQTVLMQTMKNP